MSAADTKLDSGLCEGIIPARDKQLVDRVIVVDGQIGGGKGLISSIVGALPRVEMWLHRPEIEQVCGLFYLKQISIAAASTLIRLWSDEAIYKLMMGRDVNCRPSDHSSIRYDARPWRYVKRLFSLGGEEAEQRIKSALPVLNFMTHAITGYADPIFAAFRDKLVFVRLTRHPCSTYMLNHLSRWCMRWGVDTRNGMLLYKFDGNDSTAMSFPFHVLGYEKEYLEGNAMDRAILLLSRWQKAGDAAIDRYFAESGAVVIEVPFEKFVFNPLPYMKTIASALNTGLDRVTYKMMRKQKVPRKSLTDAPENRVYRALGWHPPDKHKTVGEQIAEGRTFASHSAAKKSIKLLDELSADYERRHDLLPSLS